MTPLPAKRACARAFEAEAMRDGRLTGAARSQFEAHAAVCASCAHELRALQVLSEKLRATVVPEPDELRVRRERTRLLAAFDASLVPPARSGAPKRWLVLAAAALLLLAGALVAVRAPRPLPSVASAPASIPAAHEVKVRAEPSARWSRRTEHALETLTLESGTLNVHVEHGSLPHRLIVVLPDGELEDIGTTFSVTASAGHTSNVSVQQGRVVLRLRDRAPLLLGAGETWRPAPSPPVPAPSVTTTSSGPARPRRPLASSASDPSNEFRAAMAALNDGDNRRAALLFAAFSAAHPRDARGEDAAYLTVIARQRAGEIADMRRAAESYLQRYPNGFRRDEVEALTR